MSVSRPARCIISGQPILTLRPRIRCRNFHSSPNLSERRRPRYPNVKASDMGLVTHPNRRPATELFKPYSEEEKAALAKKYTPAQIRAIEAGEEAITPNDLNRQGIVRTDNWSLEYLDDLSKLRSVVDKRPQYEGPIDPKSRLMTEDEYSAYSFQQLKKIMDGYEEPAHDDPDYDKKARPNRLDLLKMDHEAPGYMGSNGPLSVEGQSAMAPGLPNKLKLEDEIQAKSTEVDEDAENQRDPDGIYNRLRKQTGYSLDEIREFRVKVLVSHQVRNQTRMGKIDSLYCLAIAGNGNGRLGLGQAKGQEAENTRNLAKIAAIRNMQPVPRYEERTIFGEVEGKVSAVEVKLMARPPGFGVRCQHNIFEMARAAGIHDLASRVPRSRNKMNTIKAAYQALMKQRIPDEIARGRGKKLVDVRKVYYGGRV